MVKCLVKWVSTSRHGERPVLTSTSCGTALFCVCLDEAKDTNQCYLTSNQNIPFRRSRLISNPNAYTLHVFQSHFHKVSHDPIRNPF